MHRAWVNVTAGRLKSDIRYSVKCTYNTFPWPTSTPSKSDVASNSKAVAAIEKAASAVLAARAQFADSSLADLYDPLTMPPALLKVHQQLDRAVDAAYEADGGPKTYANEAARVAFLFARYQALTSLLPTTATPKKPRTKHLKA